MKLNDKGWGIVTFLMFLCMFFVFLLLIVCLINKYNDRLKYESNEYLIISYQNK